MGKRVMTRTERKTKISLKAEISHLGTDDNFNKYFTSIVHGLLESPLPRPDFKQDRPYVCA